VETSTQNSGRVVRQLEETVDGLTFYRTPPPGSLAARMPVINQWAIIGGLARRLKQVIKQVRPDILHAHSPALNGVAALKFTKRHGLPLVYEVRAFWEDAAVDHKTTTEGSTRYRMTRAMETHVLKHADAVTTICEGLRQDILARGLDDDKVTVIPNAVNVEQFHGADSDHVDELRRKLGLDQAKVLGFIGSFYAYEGLSLLLESLPRILLKMPDVRVLLVGGGPEEENLKALAKSLDIQKQVVFTGRVPHAEVNQYYELVDAFVYPRLAMRLTELVTPLKPLEAMAQGRLVVASDVGGHKELIRDGETGLLFSAGKVDSLATTVVRLLQHRERWPAQRVAARRFVEHERQWSAVVERYRSIYETLLLKPEHKSPAVG